MQTQATPGLPSLSRSTVFVKTSKGRQEIAQRSQALSGKQRTVLIMLDGSKSLQTMESALPAGELAAIVEFLRDQDYITMQGGTAVAPAARPAPATPAARPAPATTSTQAARLPPAAAGATTVAVDTAAASATAAAPQQLQDIKDYMRSTTRAHLGLMAADVIRKIDLAADTLQLMAVIGHWHMALHDSKYGKPFAALYLTQVKASLDGAALPPSPTPG